MSNRFTVRNGGGYAQSRSGGLQAAGALKKERRVYPVRANAKKGGGAPGQGPVQSYALVRCTAQPGLAAYWGGLIPMLAGAYAGGEFAQLGGQLTEVHSAVGLKQSFHQGVTFDFLLKNILNGLRNPVLYA